MRPRKFLLVTKALTTAGLLAACKKEDIPPPPGNPKGNFATQTDAAPIPPPANPKGSGYAIAPDAPEAGAIGPGDMSPPGNSPTIAGTPATSVVAGCRKTTPGQDERRASSGCVFLLF